MLAHQLLTGPVMNHSQQSPAAGTKYDTTLFRFFSWQAAWRCGCMALVHQLLLTGIPSPWPAVGLQLAPVALPGLTNCPSS
jgi:hypothetical protein